MKLARQLWRDARRHEKILLVLALFPVPGPFDEILGVLVARRILARTGRAAGESLETPWAYRWMLLMVPIILVLGGLLVTPITAS